MPGSVNLFSLFSHYVRYYKYFEITNRSNHIALIRCMNCRRFVRSSSLAALSLSLLLEHFVVRLFSVLSVHDFSLLIMAFHERTPHIIDTYVAYVFVWIVWSLTCFAFYLPFLCPSETKLLTQNNVYIIQHIVIIFNVW